MEISKIINNQRHFFATGATLSLDFRLAQLKKWQHILNENEVNIIGALQQDLQKHPNESLLHEVMLLKKELQNTIKNLKKWAHAFSVATPFPALWPGKSTIHYEPFGCTLIIGAWNFPLLLTLLPMIGAISAGNTIILKPSEFATHTQQLLTTLIHQHFDPHYIEVLNVDGSEMDSVLTQRFDFVFFTGSTAIGKKILQSAANHLTPVVLELGGKSPCIVDESADVAFAAKRIIWAKMMNAGQTCIAPDYLYVHSSQKLALINELKKTIKQFYGDDTSRSESYGRVVNMKHLQRLKSLLTKGKILAGGQFNDDSRYLAPTLIDDISWEDPIMQEEIFGPILPILTFDNIDHAILTLNQHPKPLALYLFTKNKNNEKKVIERVSFGAGCINDCLSQMVNHHLPFGGVGMSGMGRYHGKYSFLTFSHAKGVYQKNTLVHITLPYPPHTQSKLWWLRKLLRF